MGSELLKKLVDIKDNKVYPYKIYVSTRRPDKITADILNRLDEDIEINISLNNANATSDVYKNPVFELTFPKEIKNPFSSGVLSKFWIFLIMFLLFFSLFSFPGIFVFSVISSPVSLSIYLMFTSPLFNILFAPIAAYSYSILQILQRTYL